MKTLIRLEELGFLGLSIYLFSLLGFAWWYFPVLLFVPDISMLAYAAGPGTGAWVYNLVHHRGLALVYFLLGMWLSVPVVSLVGVILLAHSSLDRVFGYGLKYPDAFDNTHLGRIGRNA